MILQAFSDYLKEQSTELSTVEVLFNWLKNILSKEPKDNIERIVHNEISCIKDNKGVLMFVGRTSSGKVLIEALYNFSLYYENYKFSKWVHDTKASNFTE